MQTVQVQTPHGLGRAFVHEVDDPRAALLLGHGAGGSTCAPDLVVARDAALDAHVAVALFEQPYRVAGRRSAAPAHQLDAAWIAAAEQLTARTFATLPLVTGGRSSGARVACRTARATASVGVLCLAFPLRPPPRANRPPAPARQDELDGAGVPVLVVQGRNDSFGVPEPAPEREVALVAGGHRLAAEPDRIADAIRGWLERVLAGA